MGKTTDLSPSEKGLIVGAPLAGLRFQRRLTSLVSQKQPYQRFSEVRIRTRSLSLEDVTEVRVQFSKSVIGVLSEELYGGTGTLL